MWLFGKSVNGLSNLLGGFDLAENFHEVPTEAKFGGFDFETFERWVIKTYNPEGLAKHSFQLAADLAGSDAAGFDLWFKWYDEFSAASADKGKP